jgi:hypothetical protein
MVAEECQSELFYKNAEFRRTEKNIEGDTLIIE